jgi:serine/threonine-protein kinase
VPAPGSTTSTFPAAVPAGERRRRGAGAALLLSVAVLAALALLGFGIQQYRLMQQEASKVSVPVLVNLPRDTAVKKLNDAGLGFTETTTRDDAVPEGSVVSQDPSPGTRVDPDTAKVRLVISSGPNAVLVPDLKGMTVAEATTALEKAKLSVGRTVKVDTNEQPKDRVVSSDPAGGTSLPPGEIVNLNVSTGQVVVPKLTGMTQDEASAALSKIGLFPKTEYEQTTGAKEGTVIAQNPDEKEKVDVGSDVTIVVAQKAPPPPTTISPSPTPTPTPTPTPSQTPTATPTSPTVPPTP